MTDAAKEKALTQAQIRQQIAEKTGFTAKQVSEVLSALGETAVNELNRAGSFTIQGLVKFSVKQKPATEEVTKYSAMLKRDVLHKAKPASKSVKVNVLKELKDGVV